jgi:hypothetical protein
LFLCPPKNHIFYFLILPFFVQGPILH